MTREVLLGYVGKRVTVCHGSGALAGAVTGLLDEVTPGYAWFSGNIGIPIGRITSIEAVADTRAPACGADGGPDE